MENCLGDNLAPNGLERFCSCALPVATLPQFPPAARNYEPRYFVSPRNRAQLLCSSGRPTRDYFSLMPHGLPGLLGVLSERGLVLNHRPGRGPTSVWGATDIKTESRTPHRGLSVVLLHSRGVMRTTRHSIGLKYL